MKHLLFFIFLLLFSVSNAANKNNVSPEHNVEKVTNNLNTFNNKEILIKIIDKKTFESLPGVKCGEKYSDLNGVLRINKGEIITLELISYNKMTLNNIHNDTIITMSTMSNNIIR